MTSYFKCSRRSHCKLRENSNLSQILESIYNRRDHIPVRLNLHAKNPANNFTLDLIYEIQINDNKCSIFFKKKSTWWTIVLRTVIGLAWANFATILPSCFKFSFASLFNILLVSNCMITKRNIQQTPVNNNE